MPDASPAAALLFLREEELALGLELLFFAERDLGAGLDAPLAECGLSRAHGRVIQFVGRQPQITVGDLIAILRITKQSLSRLVQELTTQGRLVQRVGQRDRRQRQLALTEEGRALERKLWERQRRQIARAYRETGPHAVEGFRKVLLGLVEAPEDRRRFERAAQAPGAR